MSRGPDVSDLAPETRGRINGLLLAVEMLYEHREQHHADWEEHDKENTRRHHRACYNTYTNSATRLEKKAIEIAMEESAKLSNTEDDE